MTLLDCPASALDTLAAAKVAAGLTVSVCIPARNEAATLAGVLGPTIDHHLVDEVIVIDDGSTDGTGDIAAMIGARVVRREGLPGKGRAMAAGAQAAEGDVLVFLDADVRNFGVHFIADLVEPLVRSDAIQLVKGTYRRPWEGIADEGGRVLEDQLEVLKDA